MSRYRNILAAIAATFCLSVNAGYFGAWTNRNAIAITYGTNAVTAVYCGSNLVWIALPDVTDGLVAWWKLDGNALDSIGTNHGTVNGATVVPGNKALCYSFDGINDNIDLGTSVLYSQSLSSYTVTFWVYADPADLAGKATAFLDDCAAGSQHGLLIYCDKRGASDFLYAGDAYGGVVYSGACSTSGWHHIATALDGSAFTLTVYLDGVKYPTTTSFVNLSGDRHMTLASANDGSLWLNGKLQDVRIYGRALSSNEVNTVYNRYK